MAGRIAAPLDPVTLTFDGEKIVAARGEPLACALVAANKIGLARSPKFHRPRGPSCMRSACDGCLARVDGAPNVMTCMVPVRDGMIVKSQNTLGSRDVDFLRVTDWFFPAGLNHHELFAGIPGVQQVMQIFARRVAGLGRLPDQTREPRKAARRELDVLVVGSGVSGMAIASELATKGRSVEVIDDALAPGGSLRALGLSGKKWRSVADSFTAHVTRGDVKLRMSTTAGGVYGDDTLVVGPEGAEVLTARAVIFASGAHDGALAFEGNDLPGVMSARAGGFLLARGVVLGAKIVIAISEGGGPFGEAYAEEAARSGLKSAVTLVRGEPTRARGTSRVKGVTVGEGKRAKTFDADALLVDAPRAPAYELCEQAGAKLVHRPFGFVAQTENGRIRPGFWAVGEVLGAPFEVDSVLDEARRVAAAL